MRRPMCVLSTLFLLSLAFLLRVFSFVRADHDRLFELPDDREITVGGKVTDLAVKGEKLHCMLKACTIELYGPVSSASSGTVRALGQNGKYGILVYFPVSQNSPVPKIGSRVLIRGNYHKFKTAENEGQFDVRAYYCYKGIDGSLSDPVLLGVSRSYSRLDHALFVLRNECREIFDCYLGEEYGGIMAALLLGDKTGLEQETKDLYQNAGIAHVLSLSGLHVAVIGLGLLKLCKKILRRLFATTALCRDLGTGGLRTSLVSLLLSGTVLILWCMMTGSAVSTVRALLMFFLCGVADLMGRTYDLLSAAAFASIAAAIVHPLCIFEAGYQLSFAAVVSIGVIFPRLQDLCSKKGRNRLTEGVLLSVSIQIGTLPVVAWHYYQLPLCGVFLNLLVVPLMTVVLVLGVVFLLCGLPLPALGGFAEKICLLPAALIRLILLLYEKCAGIATSLPASVWIVGKPREWQIVLYYAFLLSGIVFSDAVLPLASADLPQRGRHGRKNVRKGGSKTKRRRNDLIGRHNIGLEGKKRKVWKTLIFCGISIIACVILQIRPREVLEIRNLSVGQGDCSLLFDKTCVIVMDCGSSSESEVGRYRLIPCLKANGIGRIDLLFVSHFDSDHVNGLLELLEDPVYSSRIKQAVVSCRAEEYDGKTENFTHFIKLCKQNGVPVYTMKYGDRIGAGSLEITCLSPRVVPVEYEDTNAASLVLGVLQKETGFRSLFTGDIGQTTENALLSGRLQACDYLKVPHHGSGTSSSQAFLDALICSDHPCFCVISVGRNNRYGHPHPETLSRLHSHENAFIFRTDEEGETILKVSDTDVRMEDHRGRTLHPE